MTLPFALAMYPCMRLARGASRARLLLFAGSIASIPLLFALGCVPRPFVAPSMAALGLASAAMFAGVLALARGERGASSVRALAWVNGAGCLGMLVGPAAAGVTCAILRDAADPCRGYRGAFVLAAVAAASWTVLASVSMVVAHRGRGSGA
jgi:hypothetical protein